ncbi:MAG: UbiD family decarboxylase, partial [Chloroflexota bacterium]|nr:UbiD family decarboxylase [Chloroflexota bacterium]
QELIRRLRENKLQKPVVVDNGPCKDIKLFGDDIDLVKIPVPLSGEFESTPHLTAGISFIQDPDTGWTNAGIRRFQIMAKNRLCNLVAPFQHEGIIFGKYKRRGKPCPIAIPMGVDPIAEFCCMLPAPEQVDEMDIWAQITGQPLEVVKCETSDILVPASAEIVIEGEMAPDDYEFEGPFPEFTGYYSGFRMCPVITVKAITMRKDAISRFMYMATPPSEGHSTSTMANESQLYQKLKEIEPAVVDVAVLSTYSMTVAVSIDKQARKMRPGLEKRIGMAAKLMGPLVKNVFLVDDDVNPHNVDDVLWCMSTRFQVTKNVTAIEETSGVLLDPSETLIGPGFGYTGHSSLGIFDCTEKLTPYDEGYQRGVVLPPHDAIQKIEANWSKYGF